MLPSIINNIEQRLSLDDVLKHYGAKPASSQLDGQAVTRYFCPFRRCRGDKFPHFVVMHDRLADEYGLPLSPDWHINKDAVTRERWRCERSRLEGYGVVSLVAAICGFSPQLHLLTREQWITTLTTCADIAGFPTTELADEARNGWLAVLPPKQQWNVRLSDTFNGEAFRALSLNGYEGIRSRDVVKILHEQFGLWQVERYTTPGCYPNGDRSSEELFKSYERRAHSLFPIFAFCYDFAMGIPLAENPEKRTDKWVARIVMPYFVRQKGEDFDFRQDFWTVFNSSDVKTDLYDWNQRNLICGDVVAVMSAMEKDAVKWAGTIGEELVTEREVEEDDPKHKGSTKKTLQPIEREDIRLKRCVLCHGPLDGVSAYLWLNYPRIRFSQKSKTDAPSAFSQSFWHVCWLKSDEFLLNSWENQLLFNTATEVFELLGNDRSEISMANANAVRHNYLRFCLLPTSMSEMSPVDSGNGIPHVPHSPLDYFRYYEPTTDERVRSNMLVGSPVGEKALLLQRELNGSSPLRPFTRVYAARKKAGEKNYKYEIDMAAAWQMMANKGYCRSIPEGSRTTIGECYRIDGHFIYDLDPSSVMADMRKSLEDYAKDAAPSSEDAAMMLNAMLRCKDLQNERNISKLPLMAMPKSESYGPNLDYFFFRNGALEITKTSITFRSYDDLDFLIYRSQIMPFDYEPPFYGNQSPIAISLNPDYKKLKEELDNAQQSGADDSVISELSGKLTEMSELGQWDIQITPTEPNVDVRMTIPSAVRADDAHNAWLRWWPFLRLLRCFANEDWQAEEYGTMGDLGRKTIMARMANLMFTIGRCLYRYHDNVQYMPYFLENTVDNEGRAQGGSGKSMLVQNFFSFARHVLQVNAKNLGKSSDFANFFSGFTPHYHDVVHIEDFPKMPIDLFFNYATGRFEYRKKYSDVQSIAHDESPIIVFTSNFAVQSTDESSLGRILFGGMSHYFRRSIDTFKIAGRSMDTIDPDFCYKPEECDIERRSQIIYTLAKCVQFCMVATGMKMMVSPPGNNLLKRLCRTEVGDTFYEWFQTFLSRDYVYNAPIAINEIFNDYREFVDPSRARYDMLSRAKFYEAMGKYCSRPANGVSFMPISDYLCATEYNRGGRQSDEKKVKSYIRCGKSWLTRAFLDGDGQIRLARVLSSNGGTGNYTTGGAVWFSRIGQEPKSREEYLRLLAEFENKPDPAPILDDDGNPITEQQWSQWTMLRTEVEQETLRKYGASSRSREQMLQSASASASVAGGSTAGLSGEANLPEELPF